MHWDQKLVALFLRTRYFLRSLIALHPVLGILLVCGVLSLVVGLMLSQGHMIVDDGPTLPWPWPV